MVLGILCVVSHTSLKYILMIETDKMTASYTRWIYRYLFEKMQEKVQLSCVLFFAKIKEQYRQIFWCIVGYH